MADEVVCPKPELEERCKPRCVKYLLEYEARSVHIRSVVHVGRSCAIGGSGVPWWCGG